MNQIKENKNVSVDPLDDVIGKEDTNEVVEYNFIGRIPFLIVHLGCFLVYFTGFSPFALWLCFSLVVVRMFGITGGYHRYFSHKTYKTSRVFQFILGFLGTLSCQHGPVWWAAHHRRHHRYSDQKGDVHSPRQKGFFYAHMGWLFTKDSFDTDKKYVSDLVKFPELLFLDKYFRYIALSYATFMFFLGYGLNHFFLSCKPVGFKPWFGAFS